MWGLFFFIQLRSACCLCISYNLIHINQDVFAIQIILEWHFYCCFISSSVMQRGRVIVWLKGEKKSYSITSENVDLEIQEAKGRFFAAGALVLELGSVHQWSNPHFNLDQIFHQSTPFHPLKIKFLFFFLTLFTRSCIESRRKSWE